MENISKLEDKEKEGNQNNEEETPDDPKLSEDGRFVVLNDKSHDPESDESIPPTTAQKPEVSDDEKKDEPTSHDESEA